jgi:hypothetical protein
MKYALAVVVAFACKRHEPPPPPRPDPSDVVVQTTGLEPRTALRYALAKGSHTTVDLAIESELHAGDMGGPMPTIEVTLELAVEDVLADGRMKLRTTVTEASARDRPGAKATAVAVAVVLEQLKGIAIVATLSPEGKITDAHADLGDKKLPDAVAKQLSSLTRGFDQLAMPLPRDPVGATAKWTSTRQLDLDGMAVTSTATVELVSVTGAQIAFTSKTALVGPDQQITRDGLAIDVTNLRGTGSAHGTIDLGKLATAGGFEQALHSDMAAAGENTPLDMTTKLELRPR